MCAIIFASIGCSSGSGGDDQQFIAAFKANCTKYEVTTRKVNTTPSPYRVEMKEGERFAAYADLAKKAGDEYEALANEEKKLTPSAKFAAVHNEAFKLYALDAHLWHQLDEGARVADAGSTRQFIARMKGQLTDQMGKLNAEAELLKEDPSIASAVHDMDQPDPARNPPMRM